MTETNMTRYLSPPRLFFLLALTATLLATGFHCRDALAWQAWGLTQRPAFAIALAPRDTALRLAIGYYFFGHGAYDLDQAKSAYTQVLALDPENRDAHYQLARIHFLESDFPQAIEHIDQTLALDPEFSKAYYMKGLILGYRGSLIEAIGYFEHFIELVPDNWAGYNDLAWIHFQLGRYEKTLAVAEAGLAQSPENPWLLNMRGLALLNLDRPAEAAEAFAHARVRADEMQPENWGQSYPGNDPKIYAEGLERMREAIGHNLDLVGAAQAL